MFLKHAWSPKRRRSFGEVASRVRVNAAGDVNADNNVNAANNVNEPLFNPHASANTRRECLWQPSTSIVRAERAPESFVGAAPPGFTEHS